MTGSHRKDVILSEGEAGVVAAGLAKRQESLPCSKPRIRQGIPGGIPCLWHDMRRQTLGPTAEAIGDCRYSGRDNNACSYNRRRCRRAWNDASSSVPSNGFITGIIADGRRLVNGVSGNSYKFYRQLAPRSKGNPGSILYADCARDDIIYPVHEDLIRL